MDALKLIKIPEDSAFLLAQRERGHGGTMASVDKVLSAKEKQVKQRAELKRRHQKACAEHETSRNRAADYRQKGKAGRTACQLK